MFQKIGAPEKAEPKVLPNKDEEIEEEDAEDIKKKEEDSSSGE